MVREVTGLTDEQVLIAERERERSGKRETESWGERERSGKR